MPVTKKPASKKTNVKKAAAKVSKTYGHFSADNKEFIITDPFTPRPWINYMANGDYCSLISHTGGGFSFYLDHRHHGVLRRELRQSSDDLPGRLWYIQDQADGEFWTANAFPVNKVDSYEARHGFGKTSIAISYKNIESKLEWFVAPGLNGEFGTITLKNCSKKTRILRVFSYQEFILGNFDQDSRERPFEHLFLYSSYANSTVSMINNRWSIDNTFAGNAIWPHKVFVTTDTKPTGVTSNRDNFVGYMHSPANPEFLGKKNLKKDLGFFTDEAGMDAATVYQWNITLKAGESKTINIYTGIIGRDDKPFAITPKLVKTKRAECDAYWNNLMDTLTVETPDKELDCFVNYWNKYQMMINNWLGRGPSYYHKDQIPAMRDCCQDSYGMLPLIPGETRDKLVRIFSFMFKDGRVGGGCNRVIYKEKPTEKADLALWMVMALKHYIVETGDTTILDVKLPFLDGGESSLLAHVITGVDRVINQRGAHGIPLIANGDWNDALDKIGDKGKGESVWLGQFLYYTLGEFSYVLGIKKDTKRIAHYTKVAAELKANLEKCHWDGKWFVRAFNDEGKKVGSHVDKEAMIYINSQTWAVISGVGTKEQHVSAMASVSKYLETEYGLTNLFPAYSKPDPKVGIISRFISGHKENAAIFSHATAFNLIARAYIGDGESFYRIYRKCLPSLRDSDNYKAEPYIYSQYCAGPASGHYGEAAYHWLTGTAAWMFRAVVDYMLGVQPTDKGLQIVPCLPASFKKYSVKRIFRGATYKVEVKNPKGLVGGNISLVVDGVAVSGNVVPIKKAGSICKVVVTIG